MLKKYEKITPLKTYIILIFIIMSFCFVIYGLFKYAFYLNISPLIHSLFVISGFLYLFFGINLIDELLNQEGITYKLCDDKIIFSQLFSKDFSIMWQEIKEFYKYKINMGRKYIYIYSLEAGKDRQITIGPNVENMEDLINEITSRTGIQFQEKDFPGDIILEKLYYFSSNDKNNPHSTAMKGNNIFNIFLLLFFLLASFILEGKLNAMPEETKRNFLLLQFSISIPLIIAVLNLVFYKILQKNKTLKSFLGIFLILINFGTILFLMSGSIALIFILYQKYSLLFANFYMLLIILVITFFVLFMGNVRSILWTIKQIK